PFHAPPLNVCIQVRLADEPGKGGVAPDELMGLASCVRQLPKLRLRGLMCIPPPSDTFEAQRAWFARLASYRRELCEHGFEIGAVSIGMSDDMEAATAAGATWVRIGTAIFGARYAKHVPGRRVACRLHPLCLKRWHSSAAVTWPAV